VLIVAAVAAVAILVGGALVVNASRPERRPDETATDAETEPSPAAYADLNAVVGLLQGYVERSRGLRFKSPVKVTILKVDPFKDRLRAASKLGAAKVTGHVATMRALHLLPPDVDVVKEQEAAYDSVLGFYDPDTKELYVRGVGTTPYVRWVLVHELTHALDDQHFDLARFPSGHDDTALAASALVEGNAMRIQEAYQSTLQLLEKDAIVREGRQRSHDIYGTPFYLSLGNFPYVEGPKWVQTIMEAGGQGALDAAFGNPPTSSSEIVIPDRWFAGDRPTLLPNPPAGGPVVDQGTIGLFELAHLLRDATDGATALDLAVQWESSRFVTWTAGNQSCTRARFVMTSGSTNQALARALGGWARLHPGASVSGGGGVTLTSCVG